MYTFFKNFQIWYNFLQEQEDLPPRCVTTARAATPAACVGGGGGGGSLFPMDSPPPRSNGVVQPPPPAMVNPVSLSADDLLNDLRYQLDTRSLHQEV
jgi:hypothetical protein